MLTERTSVGLDRHTRSVAATTIDGVTREWSQPKLTPSHEHIRSWVQDLRGDTVAGAKLATLPPTCCVWSGALVRRSVARRLSNVVVTVRMDIV